MEVVAGATNSLLRKLGGLLQEEYNLGEKVKKDIESLQNELIFMNIALGVVAELPPDQLNEPVRRWAIIIRELSYDMEDVVIAFVGCVKCHGPANLESFKGFFRNVINKFLMCQTHHQIASMIEEIKRLTAEVALLRDRYRLGNFADLDGRTQTHKKRTSGLGGGGHLAAEHQEATRQLIGIKDPVGIGADMKELQDWIIFDENKELGVLSIYGFGGVGKTTAAMALYRKCGLQFKRRAMVTVSHNKDPDLVLRDILRQVRSQLKDQQGQSCTESISEKKNQAAPMRMLSRVSQIRLCSRKEDKDEIASKEHQALKEELEEHLGKNRYLLLFDDVWSSSMWQTIRKCLPKEKEGSRIIVTTRFEAVARASNVGHHKFHKMVTLAPEDAKDLFERSLYECRVTQGSQESQNDQVPARVWEMCGGLPLAIVTMAGLVASKPLTERSEWSELCNTLFPQQQVCRKPDEFMRIINYCYNVLPSDVKACSLHLCIFPKGRKISRKRLIRRWISEGFLSEKQGLSVEDVAETCFNQLIERKIIRALEHSSNGKVKSCQVDDMILEYIISKAGEENFVTLVGGQWSTPTGSNKVRRLSLHNSDSKSKHAEKADSMNLFHVRSLTVFGSYLPFKSIKTGRIMQVLDLEGCRGSKVNHVSISAICEMTLLKYLSLRGTDISMLPLNIKNLKYLETLDIRETGIRKLPVAICHLKHIRNILGGDKKKRETLQLPKDVKGAMKELHILSGVEIVEGSTAASDIQMFTRLTKLAIYKLHEDDQMFNDLLSSIQYLSGYALQTLVIDYGSSHFLDKLDNMSAPPIYLSGLELSGKLLGLPKWFPDLNDLVKLTLSASALGTKNLVTLSRLQSLFSLTFSISTAANKDPEMAAILEENKSDSRGDIFVPVEGFGKLKLLRIFLPLLPSLNFYNKSTPLLERLELRFKRLEGLHGMDELGSLHEVLVTVDDKAGEPTKSILEDLKGISSRKYALTVNEYHD